MSGVIIMMHRQRDLVERFRRAGATSSSMARSLSELGVERTFMFARMSARGVLVCAEGERWWCDAAAWNRYRDRQRKRLAVGAIVIIVISVLMLLALKMR